MIVEGQVHGGLAQGIGQALLEHGVYDDDTGQLLTGSYMDYAMPRADDLPSFNVETVKGTPCTHNPLGVKGCGEAGAIGSPPAVINAICDAHRREGRADAGHRRTPCGRRRSRGPLNRRDTPCKHSTTKPAVAWPTRRSAAGARRCQAARRRPVAARRDEARPRGARRRWSTSAGIAELQGHQRVGRRRDDRRHDHARRGRRRRKRCSRRSRRWPRWPAASATARCATAAPSAAAWPTTTRRPTTRPRCSASARRSTPTSRTIAADDFFKGLYETALQRRRDHHRGELPGAREGRLAEVQAAGVALRARRRVRQQGHERRARGGHRRRAVRVPRQGAGGQARVQLVGRRRATA